MPVPTKQEVRDYIAALTSAELTIFIGELKSDFALPDSVTFATTWLLGTSDHSHQITMSESDFEALINGSTVIKTSWTNLNHSHNVTITYATGVVSITIDDNHVGNLHTLVDDLDTDVVDEYIPVV